MAAAPQGALGKPGDNLFVEIEVGEGDQALTEGVVVQQQVPLTVRLFSARPLVGGDLSEPRVADAVVSKLGEDRQFRTQRDGRDYSVVERHYSLSPEKSGDLHIPPIVFKGSVRAGPGPRPAPRYPRRGLRRPWAGSLLPGPGPGPLLRQRFGGADPFGAFERGEPVRAQSKALDLKVKARPDGVAGSNWLPAQGLEIADSWTQSPPQLRVGEPVSRTLTLTAKGLAGAQIPAVELPAVDGLRVYPEQTQHETRTDGETIYGVSRQGLTLIPSQAGTLTIPEVRVTWWDTDGAAGAGGDPAGLEPGGRGRRRPGRTPSPWRHPPRPRPPPRPAPSASARTRRRKRPGGRTPSQGTDQPPRPAPRPPFYQRPNVYVGLALVLAGMAGLLVLRRRGRSRVALYRRLGHGKGPAAAVPQAGALEDLGIG